MHGEATTAKAMSGSRHPRFRFRLDAATLFLCGILVAGYWLLRPLYYAWVLSGPALDIVVYCDVSPLRQQGLQAFVLYDKIALSPVARFLGLYQNRPVDKVGTFHARRVPDVVLEPYAATLKGVPAGPVCRVVFLVAGRRFEVPLPDRVPKNGKLYVHLGLPAGSGVAAARLAATTNNIE